MPCLLYLYPMRYISELFIYPIKSLGGVAVQEAMVTDRGFQYDRRWMLVDGQNVFMSQRSIPKMALLQVYIEANGLRVAHKKTGAHISIPFEPAGEILRAQVWSFEGKAIEVSPLISEWFTATLAQPCKLVYMPDSTRRRVDSRYVSNKELTSFTDDFPYLAVGQSSLDELNKRLKQPIPMNRFRPNIVITGAEPFEEDEWAHFTVNTLDFYGAKLCGRCAVTTIDQEEAIQGKEPLLTLSTYRKSNNKIYFGQYLVHKGEGRVSGGDVVSGKEMKKGRFPRVSV
jgi:uncharacterized protein